MRNAVDAIENLPLEKITLFKFVPPEALEGILDRCRFRTLEKEETLLIPDQANRELFILLAGRLRIHLQHMESEPVALIEPGEVAGELSVIDGNRTSAFVVANERSRVLIMDQEIVWSLVTVSHAAACNLLSIVSNRLRHANAVIAEKMLLEHSYHRYGTVDALTGMHNRHWLNGVLARLVTRNACSGAPMSVLMVDIDCFKTFNDTYGHLSGDRAIHTVAQALLQNLRPTEMAARYGGDEFFIVLPDVNEENARLVAERLLQKVREKEIPRHDGSLLPPLTISLGLAAVRRGQTAEDVIAAADAALYRAKKHGRNTISD